MRTRAHTHTRTKDNWISTMRQMIKCGDITGKLACKTEFSSFKCFIEKCKIHIIFLFVFNQYHYLYMINFVNLTWVSFNREIYFFFFLPVNQYFYFMYLFLTEGLGKEDKVYIYKKRLNCLRMKGDELKFSSRVLLSRSYAV